MTQPHPSGHCQLQRQFDILVECILEPSQLLTPVRLCKNWICPDSQALSVEGPCCWYEEELAAVREHGSACCHFSVVRAAFDSARRSASCRHDRGVFILRFACGQCISLHAPVAVFCSLARHCGADSFVWPCLGRDPWHLRAFGWTIAADYVVRRNRDVHRGLCVNALCVWICVDADARPAVGSLARTIRCDSYRRVSIVLNKSR